MDHKEAGHYWNESAESWTKLARAGYDVYRDYLNTPAFFAMLPSVEGLAGLDIGCGEGHNTRLLSERGARVAPMRLRSANIFKAVRAKSTNGFSKPRPGTRSKACESSKFPGSGGP